MAKDKNSNGNGITVIQFSIDKNRIEFRKCARASAALSFHDQFAFLFVLTAVKCPRNVYIGYDHFFHLQRQILYYP